MMGWRISHSIIVPKGLTDCEGVEENDFNDSDGVEEKGVNVCD